jgi:hypothetical protein
MDGMRATFWGSVEDRGRWWLVVMGSTFHTRMAVKENDPMMLPLRFLDEKGVSDKSAPFPKG